MFSFNLTYYVIFVCLFLVSVDDEMMRLGRVNTLQEYFSYPVKYLKGEEVFSGDKFRRAKKYYEAMLGVMPYYEKSDFVNTPVSLSRLYTMIAICDYYIGDSDEAIALFSKARDLEPKHFWLNYNLGFVYYRRGEYAQAVEYLKSCLGLGLKNIDDSLQLDYYGFLTPEVAEQYKALNLLTFHEVVNNSFVLSILSFERLNKPEMIKGLALLGIKLGFGEKDSFFKYYAGLSSEKPVDEQVRYQLIYNPSLNVVPIGQEKYFTEQHRIGVEKK